jgi:two-component system, chemotaxis family, chemotaxis protein CheY
MALILLVEDNIDMQTILRELLEYGGYEVWSGRNGEEGLEVLNSPNALPDIIISDFKMPAMDGIVFLQHIRENPRWDQIRFVMMTADPYDERLKTEVSDRLNGILPKPFTLEQLTDILNN